jgi:C-terminal processing protease CtpA/Prc
MFIYLSGEYVIVSSSNPNIHIGDTVTKINGQNIDNYISEGNNVIVSNVDMYRKKLYANASMFLNNGNLTFTIRSTDNQENNFNVVFKKIASGAYVYLQPAKASSSDISTSIITQDKIAYLKVPTFTVLNIKKVDAFINSVKNYKYLIVDVRNNNGGDLGYSKELISRLIQAPYTVTNYICVKDTSTLNNKYKQAFNFYDETKALSTKEKSSLVGLPYYIKNQNYNVYKVEIDLKPTDTPFNGKVYVLTNSSCFSACEYFCNTLKRINGATLVGGYTGGDGILFIPDSKTFLYDMVYMSYSYSIGME